jgi:two-component system cell cycle response regulator CpdR
MLAFLEKALHQAKHDVVTAEDGLTALALLKANDDFDLLLCDIIMPGMDGIELSQKAHRDYPHLKVMFMTGFSAMSLGSKNPENAGNTVLSKPFHLNDLLGRITEILAS